MDIVLASAFLSPADRCILRCTNKYLNSKIERIDLQALPCCLFPLVMEGILSLSDALKYEFNDLKGVKRIERFTSSAGAFWATKLDICKPLVFQKYDISESLMFLFGLNETNKGDFYSRWTAVDEKTDTRRSIIEQWKICHWLYKNKNKTRKLIRMCIRKTIAVPLVNLIVGSPHGRYAFSNLFVLDEILELYTACGIGHLVCVFSEEGVAAIEREDFTLKNLTSIPRHNVVRALCRGSIQYDDITSMIAPLEDRSKMVDIVVKKQPENKKELLALPNLACLEFVLSSPGKRALQSNLISLDTISSNPKSSRVLQMFLQSPHANSLVESGVLTIPKVLRYIKNNQVLSVLLTPAGIQKLNNGTIMVESLDQAEEPSRLFPRHDEYHEELSTCQTLKVFEFINHIEEEEEEEMDTDQAIVYLEDAMWDTQVAFEEFLQKRKRKRTKTLPTVDQPTMEQVKIVSTFMNLTKISQEEQAVAMLILAEWKIEDAIEMYYFSL